jgi:hypothetical protein
MPARKALFACYGVRIGSPGYVVRRRDDDIGNRDACRQPRRCGDIFRLQHECLLCLRRRVWAGRQYLGRDLAGLDAD